MLIILPIHFFFFFGGGVAVTSHSFIPMLSDWPYFVVLHIVPPQLGHPLLPSHAVPVLATVHKGKLLY